MYLQEKEGRRQQQWKCEDLWNFPALWKQMRTLAILSETTFSGLGQLPEVWQLPGKHLFKKETQDQQANLSKKSKLHSTAAVTMLLSALPGSAAAPSLQSRCKPAVGSTEHWKGPSGLGALQRPILGGGSSH